MQKYRGLWGKRKALVQFLEAFTFGFEFFSVIKQKKPN